MKCKYKTKETCSKEIEFEIENNVVTNVRFLGGGCPGNLQALPRLVEGLEKEEIIKRLKGIKCGHKNTSCANELATALENIS